MSHATTSARLALAALVAATASLALLATAPAASAARDPIASGSTDLHLKKGFLRKLANNGVGVSGVGAGAVSGNKIALQVFDGKLDPTNGQGFLESKGGFKLSRGERGAVVTKLTVNGVKGAVYADVAKARMQLGELSTLTTSREGFGATLRTPQLKLTAKAAKRLSNKLGLRGSHRLNAGRTLSNAYATAQPRTVTVLPQGAATLDGNAATLAKFGAKGVKPPPGGITALAPATQPTPTSFQFPIAGGALAPDASEGTIQTAGTIQIFKEDEPYSPTMKLKDIYVDFEARTATVEIEILPSPPLPGNAGRSSIADIALPAGSLVANPATRTITITNAEVRLQAVAAATLNTVFNQPAPSPPPASDFVVGDLLGTFSMTVQAQ